VIEAKVEILFHVMLAGVGGGPGDWRMELCTKSGLRRTGAKILVDATADANLCEWVGVELRTPPETQPATMVCRMDGYDLKTLDGEGLQRAFEEALEKGALKAGDADWDALRPRLAHWLRKAGLNANHIASFGAEARSSEGKTRMEIEGRRSILRLFRFLKAQPGLDKLNLAFLAPECGIRETVTIVGEETVTSNDYLTGRKWPEALAYAFYPVDLHMPTGLGLDIRPLAPGVVPSVPRGAMIPKGRDGLLAAGRILSCDRLAHSALRVQATCMALGQAAGALAALAARQELSPRSMPLDPVRDLLREHGAIVPPQGEGDGRAR
jgi:hypothetical protein